MGKVAYMILDADEGQLIDAVGEHTKDDVKDIASDLNRSICQLTETADGMIEYLDEMPNRYRPVIVTIEEIEE